jgi:outer membrane murein-binding lipoprotein Lpp
MRKANKITLFIIGTLLLAGCASTELRLHLDLYKEDPYLDAALNNAQITRMYAGLQAVENEADSLAKDRIRLAEDLLAAYDNLYYLTSKAVRPKFSKTDLKSETRVFHENLAVYKQTVIAKAGNVIALADAARRKLDSYVAAVALSAAAPKETKTAEKTAAQDREPPAKVTKTEVVESVKEVNKAFIELGGSLDTDFEKSFIKNWPVVAAMASEQNLKIIFKKEPEELDGLRQRIQTLNTTLQELRLRGRQIPESVSKDLENAAMAMDSPEPGDIKKSVDAIAKVATDVPSALGIGDRGATALNQLLQSTTLLYSQIDRLQDPADPIWRIVTDPENEPKWNTQFSESNFYAQGNSSIVVVRDTPMSFRVQRGANNPTALVQGQLQVSRALGNAAISIAAASTGLPVSHLMGKDKAGKSTVEVERFSEGETLSRRKALTEQNARVRMRAVRNLRINLISIKEDLQKIDAQRDPEGYRKLRSKLEATLKGHEPVFSIIADKPQP